MKKILLILVVAVVSIGMLITFSLTGCKGAVEEAVTEAVEEAVEEVEEAVGEEVVEEEVDEIDPWILDVRKEVNKYRGEIDPSFKGPNGQTPSWDIDLFLTVSEVEKVREGNYKVAFNMDGAQGEYHESMTKAIQDTCDHLGMELVAVTDAGFDPTKQQSDIETTLALNPDIIISAPVDKVSAAEAFRPAVDAGVKLVFWSNQPDGYVSGKDFVGISTSMPYDQGVFMAEQLGKLVGEDGKIGFIYWEQDFWIVNIIDDIVREKIAELFPNVEILEEGGFGALEDAENIAGAMIQKYPEINGFYASFNFPAQLAAAACQSADRDDIQIVTQGVDVPILIKLLTPGENIGAVITDTPYLIGVNHVLLGAYGVLGKEAPEYTLSPSAWYTPDNVVELWDMAMRISLPDDVKELVD
jgi:ribose transport system substrate-binding protein